MEGALPRRLWLRRNMLWQGEYAIS